MHILLIILLFAVLKHAGINAIFVAIASACALIVAFFVTPFVDLFNKKD